MSAISFFWKYTVSAVTIGAMTIIVIARPGESESITPSTPRIYAKPQRISGKTHAMQVAMRSVSLITRESVCPALVTL